MSQPLAVCLDQRCRGRWPFNGTLLGNPSGDDRELPEVERPDRKRLGAGQRSEVGSHFAEEARKELGQHEDAAAGS